MQVIGWHAKIFAHEAKYSQFTLINMHQVKCYSETFRNDFGAPKARLVSSSGYHHCHK